MAELKSANIPTRFNETELAIIKRLAARAKMNLSDFVRCAVYGEFLMSMDREATVYVVSRAAGVMRKKLAAQMADWPFHDEVKEKA